MRSPFCGYLTNGFFEVSAIDICPSFMSLMDLVGILYTVLAGMLYVLAYLRQRHSLHDFADKGRHVQPSLANPIPTVGQAGKRVFGRPFVTAGWIVVALTVVVAAVEIGLLILILQV